MPTYEYRCGACGHELEVFQNISESPKKKCPECKRSKLKRKIGGGAGFLFKGSGFYLTDYRSDSYKKAAEKDSKPADAGEGATGPKKDAASEKPASAPAPAEKHGEKSKGKKGKSSGTSS